MLEKSSFPCITRPTRVTKSSATLIDNVFINCKIHNKVKSSVILHDISDHFPSILIVENIFVKKKEPKYIITCDITDCKITTVQDDLNSVNWTSALVNMNTNGSYDYFHSICLICWVAMSQLLRKRYLPNSIYLNLGSPKAW